MIQTMMERLHGSGSMTTIRRNSTIHNTNSFENNSEINLTRQKHQTIEDNDNESTSSGGSSHTTTVSLSSATSKSSVPKKTSFRHLKKLAVRNIFRRKEKKNDSNQVEMDDEEEEGERTLINDGSNGDLKYKASRSLREQTQFDKTQLLQTIVNAHDGPIWCMR
jgi:hypothetical protein